MHKKVTEMHAENIKTSARLFLEMLQVSFLCLKTSYQYVLRPHTSMSYGLKTVLRADRSMW
jgi:hypothetical protein